MKILHSYWLNPSFFTYHDFPMNLESPLLHDFSWLNRKSRFPEIKIITINLSNNYDLHIYLHMIYISIFLVEIHHPKPPWPAARWPSADRWRGATSRCFPGVSPVTGRSQASRGRRLKGFTTEKPSFTMQISPRKPWRKYGNPMWIWWDNGVM